MEGFGTWLMLIYTIASWIAVLVVTEEYFFDVVVFVVALFGGSWALDNTVKRSEFDLGVVTFGSVVVTQGMDLFLFKGSRKVCMKYAVGVSSLLVAISFFLPFLVWSAIHLALDGVRSDTWFQVFAFYIASMAAFWSYVTYYKICRRETRYVTLGEEE
mmetsp:Transcript_20889/g.31887  ORF Transcript_20889/g.31887 Transcript_20889/m.31887 type:complete len:158 (+) Transcript_20889:88-561(+)